VLRSPLPARRGDPVQRSKGHAGEVLRDVAPCLFLMQAFQRSGERFCRFIHTSPLSGVALDSTMSQVCDKTAGLFARSAKRSFWRVREQARQDVNLATWTSFVYCIRQKNGYHKLHRIVWQIFGGDERIKHALGNVCVIEYPKCLADEAQGHIERIGQARRHTKPLRPLVVELQGKRSFIGFACF